MASRLQLVSFDMPTIDEIEIASRRRTLWIARTVALAVSAGMAAWLGVRVKAASAARHAIRDEAESAKAAPPASARVVHPEPDTWEAVVAIEGSLLPAREADLGFRAGGRLGA